MLLRVPRTASLRLGPRPTPPSQSCRQALLSSTAGDTPEKRLQAVLRRLEIEALPPTPQPGGLYVPTVQHDNLIYVSGHIPYTADGEGILGLATGDDDIPRTKLAAAHNALSVLSTLQFTLGSVNRVKRLVKSFCMVNCTDDFGAHPEVMNGYSEVMQEVFGTTCGVGARSAVGMSLPHGMATEVECIFELHMEGGGDAGTASGGSDGSQTSAAFAKALGSSGLAEAVQILKAEAPRDWLIYGSSIESNLKAHFVARRAEKSDGTIL